MVQRMKRILYTASAIALLPCAVACSTAPPKTAEQRIADAELEQRVENALNADPIFFAGAITVQADNGVVHLGGFVWNDDDLYVFQRIAERVPGVTKVVDEMELERMSRRSW